MRETDNYILDADGNPQPEPDTLAWADWYENAERHVGRTEIGGIQVSTVFLGLDHSFGDGDEPILYETMLFITERRGAGRGDNPFNDYQERYRTKEEALAGHEKAVAMVKEYIAKEGNDNA